MCEINNEICYKTGDLARLNPNTRSFEYCGRRDHQVKLRGQRIELGEIETAIARCTGVAQSIVIIREDFPGTKGVAAYVVPLGEPAPSTQQINDELRRVLPAYMLPSVDRPKQSTREKTFQCFVSFTFLPLLKKV